MKLILIYGLPGVGKKTVGQELERLTDLPLFHNHLVLDLVGRYVNFKSPEAVRLCRKFTLELLEAMATSNSKGVIHTFAGRSNGSRETVNSYIDAVEMRKGEAFLVQLICNREVLLQRIKSPSRQGGNKITTEEQLDNFLKEDYFKGFDGRESLIIDNTNLQPNEVAEKIIEGLGL